MYLARMKEADTFYCTVFLTPFLMPNLGLTPSRLQGKIKRTRPFYVAQFEYLKSLVPPEVFSSGSRNYVAFLQRNLQDVKYLKITMCSPSWFHQRHGSDLTYDTTVYKNDGT